MCGFINKTGCGSHGCEVFKGTSFISVVTFFCMALETTALIAEDSFQKGGRVCVGGVTYARIIRLYEQKKPTSVIPIRMSFPHNDRHAVGY